MRFGHVLSAFRRDLWCSRIGAGYQIWESLSAFLNPRFVDVSLELYCTLLHICVCIVLLFFSYLPVTLLLMQVCVFPRCWGHAYESMTMSSQCMVTYMNLMPLLYWHYYSTCPFPICLLFASLDFPPKSSNLLKTNFHISLFFTLFLRLFAAYKTCAKLLTGAAMHV